MVAVKATKPTELRRRQSKGRLIPAKPEQVGKALESVPDDEARAFYRSAMEVVAATKIPFLVGGAFALETYTGIKRYTKDFDIFVRTKDLKRTLAALQKAGYRTEITASHWLGKAWSGNLFVDIIFSSGNGEAVVDDQWFENAPEADVLGMPVLVCPPEEMIWSKSFVMERERYDGADIAHILRACAPSLNWRRLMSRYGDKWRLLFSYLILFGFIYPAERDKIPAWVLRRLLRRLEKEIAAPVRKQKEKVVQGTLISREQFLTDVGEWGYRDGRLPPTGNMTSEQIGEWTEAIGT
jgi:hypothetical protein